MQGECALARGFDFTSPGSNELSDETMRTEFAQALLVCTRNTAA